MAIEQGDTPVTTTPSSSCLIVARTDLPYLEIIANALRTCGVMNLYQVTGNFTPEAIIARADVQGGVPIISVWDGDRMDNPGHARYLTKLLSIDTLPGRRHVLITENDVVADIAAEYVVTCLQAHSERLLICSAEALSLEPTLELLRLRLSYTRASYLGRLPNMRGIEPANVTAVPAAGDSRDINGIEERTMRCGAFNLRAPRIPKF